jgi:hypothetical protein
MKTIFLLTMVLTALGNCNQANKKIKLEKIIFHTSECFGACPTYHLQVDGDKSLKLYAERVYRKDKGFSREQDTARTGYFTGSVSDTTFNKLLQELETVGLDTLEFEGPNCCDGSLKTIIVYYNGKRKFLKAMFPPEKAHPLIAVLYEICGNSKLQRTQKKFEIEGGEAGDE